MLQCKNEQHRYESVAVNVVVCTQVVNHRELCRVSTYDPQQAEDTDAVQGGVASSRER